MPETVEYTRNFPNTTIGRIAMDNKEYCNEYCDDGSDAAG